MTCSQGNLRRRGRTQEIEGRLRDRSENLNIYSAAHPSGSGGHHTGGLQEQLALPGEHSSHGVSYAKADEGATYHDGASDESKLAVLPSGTQTYPWLLPERAGPCHGDSSSVLWMYHSHVHEIGDVNAGLVGPMIITGRGMAEPDGKPEDVDRELAVAFSIGQRSAAAGTRRMPTRRLPTSAKNGKLLPLTLMMAMSCSGGTLDQPRTIIEEAVHALGGKKELDKQKAIHARFEATGFVGDHSAPCVLESWYRYPTRLKTDLRCNVNGRQYILIQVVKGNQAWRSENGETPLASEERPPVDGLDRQGAPAGDPLQRLPKR